jgi:hypothetical protein
MNLRPLVGLALGATLAVSCKQNPGHQTPQSGSALKRDASAARPARAPDAGLRAPKASQLRFGKLGRFASAGEFDTYVKNVRQAWQRRMRDQSSPSRAAGSAGSPPPAPGAQPAKESAAPSEAKAVGGKDESITNNQEEGVDEGDIVKVSGDFFIVLRRGRLFTVRQSQAGAPTLTAVSRCNAFPEGASRGTWYDEMLVYRDRIVVIGFSYQVGGTEIGLFKLAPDGRISHQATHFLRSNDYYSARNYTGRLVGSKLIFYLPFYLRTYDQSPVQLPAVATWNPERKGTATWNDILSKMEIYRPVQRTLTPTLHTVVQCDLGSPVFSCTARALIGPYSRTFYVSRDAIYLWISPGWDYSGDPEERKRSRSEGAYVYRLPILRGDVSAVRAAGTPIDQFSFKEGGEHLNVLVADQGGGDAMWQFGTTKGQMALLRIPLPLFSEEPRTLLDTAYTRLPRPEAPTGGRRYYVLQNRFVGDWLLWGAGAGWWGQAQGGGTLYATHMKQPAAVKQVSLDHGIERIEPMAENAMIVGSGKSDLFFTSVALGESPEVRHTHVRPNAAQGETRSHGFFFLPQGQGSGLLGLPVRGQGRPGFHLLHGSAEVAFLRVSPSLQLSPLGSLAARSDRAVRDDCQVSCVDWYGNARPIFFRGRILALLGYELVEGALFGDQLRETSRIDYLSPRAASR